jgi:ABC-type sugar transport system ATPase subunit
MIRVEDLAWKAGSFAFEGLSFDVPDGTYAVLRGASGSGKTSIIELLCGLRRPLAGRILIGGVDVTALEPAQRRIGYVPQDGALFPTLRVRDQLGFALRVRHRPGAEILEQVNTIACELGIDHLLDRYPEGLSGGERQRIALGRALLSKPAVLLLDEPLSAIDEDAREGLLSLLQESHKRLRVTALHVTHSSVEAERMAEQLLVMQDGGIVSSKAGAAVGV